jgi:hypothetical protein
MSGPAADPGDDDTDGGEELDTDGGEELDDIEDAPLEEAEAAEGAALAGGVVDESLDERVGAVVDELGGVSRTRDGDVDRLAVGGRVFAVIGLDLLEVALDPAIAKAALATSDTRPSPRGTGWVAFTPAVTDRFALDRAEAWVRLAFRRAGGRTA